MPKKVSKIIDCKDYSVIVMGEGKNPDLYFVLEAISWFDYKMDQYRTPKDDSEMDEWLLKTDLKTLQKVIKETEK